MRPPIYSSEQIITYLQKEKIVSINAIKRTFGCSSSTLFRLIEEIDHYTSYSHIRKFIILKDTPTFDKDGLWEYNGILFSKWGGVQPTLKHIIDESPMGLAVSEISEILKIRVNNQLQKLLRKNAIVRHQQGRFQIYYSSQQTIRYKQMEKRKEMIEHAPACPYTTRDQLIQIILAIIEHYDASADEIDTFLQTKGIPVKKNLIRWLFHKYDIEKKGSP